MHVVYNENCLETMKRMPDNSVDSIVTDPPYGLGESPDSYEVMKSWIEHGYHEVKGKGFMAKEWDAFVPQPVIWKECFRILKPGGHLLAFSSTRTQDWMTMALRFAGFEINTSIYWVFASGMPKGLNVSKAIDKKYSTDDNLTKSVYDAMKWEGWNSQLKPAVEPITVARKPMIGNIVDNVLKYGTGTFNVNACRVGTRDTNESGWSKSGSKPSENRSMSGKNYDRPPKDEVGLGRYPSNLIHDGSDDVVDLFPNTKSGAMKHSVDAYDGTSLTGMLRGRSGPDNQYGDEGSAARFYYCAKAGNSDRNEGWDEFIPKFQPPLGNGIGVKEHDPETATKKLNHHPTAKPTSLMRYLCRLVTPVGGLVYDPFSGSGSTGKAAILEGFEFVGSELDPEYTDIANTRLKHALENKDRLADEYVLEHIEKVMPKKSGYSDNGYF